MTLDEARERIIEGMNYAAYRETDFSLYDADKNRLFGGERYNSSRFIATPSPWQGGDFEQKMATLLHWANTLNQGDPSFYSAQELLKDKDCPLGRVIRKTKTPGWKQSHYTELVPLRRAP